jgi:hypothetical protein
MADVTPPGAGPKGTLEVAHLLLRNPSGPGASPSAAEQWHHNVNQLVISTINTTPVGCQSRRQRTHAHR